MVTNETCDWGQKCLFKAVELGQPRPHHRYYVSPLGWFSSRKPVCADELLWPPKPPVFPGAQSRPGARKQHCAASMYLSLLKKIVLRSGLTEKKSTKSKFTVSYLCWCHSGSQVAWWMQGKSGIFRLEIEYYNFRGNKIVILISWWKQKEKC